MLEILFLREKFPSLQNLQHGKFDVLCLKRELAFFRRLCKIVFLGIKFENQFYPMEKCGLVGALKMDVLNSTYLNVK